MARDERGIKRHINVTLPVDLAEEVKKFKDVEGFGSEAAVITAIVRMHFAADPLQGMEMSTRSNAHNEVRTWVMVQAARAMREIAQMLELGKAPGSPG